MRNPSSHLLADELFWLSETLLPSEAPFPSGGMVGAQAAALSRFVALRGEAALSELGEALAEAGGPLAGRDSNDRVTITAALEARRPALFETFRTLLYLSYYESPLVIAAIRATGVPHNLTPLPEGYDLPPFDPARDAPRHGRGTYIRTADMRRLDLAGIPHADA